MVSPEDAQLLASWKYSAIPKPPKNKPLDKVHHRVTAMHSIKGRGTVQLHREIMKPGPGLVVDHIDGNALNNRRSNLRVATTSQNTANSRKPARASSSRFKGVSWDAGNKMWRAGVEHMGKNHFLGFYTTEEEAHSKYMERAKMIWGEFARAS